MLKFFAEKMRVAFAVQKLLTFFSAKNIRILYSESAKTVNKMTLTELDKLCFEQLDTVFFLFFFFFKQKKKTT